MPPESLNLEPIEPNDSLRAEARRAPFADDWNEFYEKYPRHRDPARARAAYAARRREGVTADRLLVSAQHYAEGYDTTDAMYPKTFLAKDGPWTEWEHGPPQDARTESTATWDDLYESESP